MVVDLPHLSRTSREPLVEQIVRHFEAAIARGQLRPGERLPTIRAAAGRLQVTRGTIQEAYRRLSNQRLVGATVGRGTEVLGQARDDPDAVLSQGARAVRDLLAAGLGIPKVPVDTAVLASFAELLPDQDSFPVDAFRASLERVLRRLGGDLLVYGQPLGNTELRALLAARSDGPDPEGSLDEILITSGAQQGIDLVLRTFTTPGDAVAVAVPTYHHLFALLRAHGLELVPIAAGEDGLDPAALASALANPRVRLLYLMPTFHNPTGRTLDLNQRQDLMRALAPTRIPVLEDDFQRELRFAGQPLPSLRALDARGLTVTVRTFSKGLFPGLRLGWVQATPQVLEPMAALKRVTDLETSPLLQAALVDFAARGALERYLGNLRKELARRHAAAQRFLAKHMTQQVTWTHPEGGFALWVEGRPGLDMDRLAELAAQRGVLVTPGRIFDPSARASTGIRLSLSRTNVTQIEQGIATLHDCLRTLRQEPSQRRNYL